MDQILKRKEVAILAGTVLLLIGYVAVNRREIFHEDSIFILTTMGVFVWLVLIMLYLIHEICEDLRREMGYTIEDNIVEIKLLKELTGKQIDEMQVLHNAISSITKKKPTKKK